MSKVYEYHLAMEELFADADYQEWIAQQTEITEQDLEEMAGEEAKAQKLAKMMLEE